MGQVQSNEASSEPSDSSVRNDDPIVSSSSSSSSSSSMESLIAEAAAFGEEGEEDTPDARAQKALECPCIAHLRSGPCGGQFSEAFLCFLKSTAEEKGSDCVTPFVALQNCIKANPDAFSREVLEDDEEEVEEEEVVTQDYKIYPPKYAKESPRPKPKL